MVRRLAAILSADVVGYTRHMARDDARTLVSMRAMRTRVDQIVTAAGGRVVDAVGDGFLAEFPSVVTATEAAATLTAELSEHAIRDPDALELRIGIHVGDILEDIERRIYGDAVNVSARLMTLADPGGIVLSGSARYHLGDRDGLETEFIGEFEVKNLVPPIPAHRVVGHDKNRLERPSGDALGTKRLESLATLPAIAVLPFENMTSDPDQDFLADGLVEDLITALSCSRWFSVISRNSSFAYKGRTVTIAEVSRQLGARYVVEGSIRRAGDRVRVTGQLVDGATGAQVWAERYDRQIDDLFDLQDELTLAITGALIPSVQDAERTRALTKHPKSLDAWECLHRGLWHLDHYEAEHQRQACEFFDRASVLAPLWGLPFAAKSWSTVLTITFEMAADVGKTLGAGLEFAERAVILSPRDAEAQHAMGWTSAFARQYDAALKAFERGIELNPSSSGCFHGKGFVHSMRDEPELALEPLRRSLLLSPQDPQLHFRRGHLGQALFQVGRFDEAIDEIRGGLALRPDYGFFYLLAASLSAAGRTEEGRAVVRDAQSRFPRNRIEGLQTFLSPSLYARHREALDRL